MGRLTLLRAPGAHEYCFEAAGIIVKRMRNSCAAILTWELQCQRICNTTPPPRKLKQIQCLTLKRY